MANQNSGRRHSAPAPHPQSNGRPPFSEPVMRRWPHPANDGCPAAAAEPVLHYIYCALSYQNQLLADIKTLLEQLTLPCEAPAAGEAATPADPGPSITMAKK